MRLWTPHPRYLDSRGLVALWREGLLAQEVLRGRTRGYTCHPQLTRFRRAHSRLGAIAEYLRVVHEESLRRGYHFDVRKISRARGSDPIDVSRGQLEFEWERMMAKLAERDPERHERLKNIAQPRPHPLFRIVAGDIEEWEKP